jgi:hypothetical protein
MVSDDADASSGATGIAWADIAIKPRPMANADAASIFMGFFSFLFVLPRRGVCRFPLTIVATYQ